MDVEAADAVVDAGNSADDDSCGVDDSGDPDNSAADADALRAAIAGAIWPAGLPTALGAEFTSAECDEHTDHALCDLDSVGAARSAQVPAGFGVTSDVVLLRSTEPATRLLVYHEGHFTSQADASEVVEYFTSYGFDVAVLLMPCYGENSDELIISDDHSFDLDAHDDVARLEADVGSQALRLFVEPALRVALWGLAEPRYDHVFLAGHSGGGWTTLWVAALLEDIRGSVEFSGSLPFDVRVGRDFGDWEQLEERPIYDIAKYTDLYRLAAIGHGRHHLQTFNRLDNKVFRADEREDVFEQYGRDVQAQLRAGGTFEVWIDEHDAHRPSSRALDRAREVFMAVSAAAEDGP